MKELCGGYSIGIRLPLYADAYKGSLLSHIVHASHDSYVGFRSLAWQWLQSAKHFCEVTEVLPRPAGVLILIGALLRSRGLLLTSLGALA